MAIADRVANGESGRERIDRKSRQKVRVVEVPDYLHWESYPGVPLIGDAYPGKPELTVVTLDMEGECSQVHPNGGDAGPNYEMAIVNVGYSDTRLEVDGVAIWTSTTSIKGLCINGGLKYGSSGGADIEQPITIIYAENQHEAARLVTSANWPLIKSLYNCVNANNWTPAGVDNLFIAGTLLFMGADSTRIPITGTDGYQSQLRFRFLENTLGWETVWSVPSSSFVTQWPLLYGTGNFSTLGL